MLWKLGLLLLTPFLIWATWDIYAEIQFDKNCGSHLKMAGDANNVETAKVRLSKAIQHIERNRLTEGNTGVFITYPNNDLEAWYKNLKSAHLNLSTFPANSSESDSANTLIKLRETLMDHSDGNDVLTLPAHIHIFPHQTLYMWTLILSIFGLLLDCFLLVCLMIDTSLTVVNA